MRTPVQPICSRCQVCDSCSGRLAPTSTKKPDRAPPKNSRTSFCSHPSGKVMRTAPRDLRASNCGGPAWSTDDLGCAETAHEGDGDHFAAIAFDQLLAHPPLPPAVAAFRAHLSTR